LIYLRIRVTLPDMAWRRGTILWELQSPSLVTLSSRCSECQSLRLMFVTSQHDPSERGQVVLQNWGKLKLRSQATSITFLLIHTHYWRPNTILLAVDKLNQCFLKIMMQDHHYISSSSVPINMIPSQYLACYLIIHIIWSPCANRLTNDFCKHLTVLSMAIDHVELSLNSSWTMASATTSS
jgi:hypothetical protein